MKVSLISYTGIGHPDPLFAARLLAYSKNTRLEQGEETLGNFMEMPEAELMREIEYISNTLRSSWEFVDFVFQIREVTRAFTHQLVRTRTGSYAQQAQRVVDLSGASVEMPKSVIECGDDAIDAWNEAVNASMSGYAKLQSIGIPNQDCRGLIPTNIHTNILAKFNLRVLADLVGKRQNLRAQGEYAYVVLMMVEEVLRVMPWAFPFLYPERTATPALDELLANALGSASPVDRPKINDALKEMDKLKAVWG